MSTDARRPGPSARHEAPAGGRRWTRLLTLGAAGGLLVAALLRLDGASVERGNRLYRSGDPSTAAELYGRALGPETGDATGYNLGTALLSFDPDSAEALLEQAAEVGERATAQRGSYNLGYRYLVAAELAPEPDSILPALLRALESNRRALRLDPSDQAARWNLALAQRRMDALLPPDDDTGRESGSESDDEVPMNDPSLARSETAEAESGPEPEDPRPADNIGERRGPQEGAREAWATQDPGPMSPGEALELLSRVNDRTEVLVNGILWSHRPDIAWWTGQAYPGGAW